MVGSLAGARPVVVHGFSADDPTHAEVTVDMGKANRLGAGSAVVGGQTFTGLGVDVGNPHLACVTDLSPAALAALDVGAPVSFDTAQFPDGVNVEILTSLADGSVDMRSTSAAWAKPVPAEREPLPRRWQRWLMRGGDRRRDRPCSRR